MKYIIYIVFLFLICVSSATSQDGKQVTLPRSRTDTLYSRTNIVDSISIDSTPWAKEMRNQLSRSKVNADTIKDNVKRYKISKDAIESEVIYSAKDSSWTDIVNKKIHLFGVGKVEYEGINVTADSIVIDFKNNILEGYLIRTKVDRRAELPTFTGEGSTFTFSKIRYNFDSKKGEVVNARTQEGEFNLLGTRTKFISGKTDSLGVKEDDRVYNENAIITTCNHDPPHFGIRASKMKFVPKKLAVLSLAQLEIERVPTPLFLPFGFFPLIKGKSSGLIFPSSYDYNEQLGLGFRGIGYYWPLGQQADLRITGDIYTRGSWGIVGSTNYKKIYGYNGNAELGYRRDVLDDEETGKKRYATAFSLRLRHTQDTKAHPYRRMGGDINFTTNRYAQRSSFTAQAQLTNTIRSGFTFAHDMPGTPFRFNAEFRHSQNLQTRKMDITLPNITLRMNTIFPFKAKNSTEEKWTDNIALSYSSEFRNYVQVEDSLLFTQKTLDNLQTGLSHQAGLSTNFRLLKYLNVSPSISHREVWLTKRYNRTFIANDSTEIRDPLTNELLGYKAPTESYESKFGTFRDFNAGITINTQIFGSIPAGKGFFRGMRHIVKPNISLNYRPSTIKLYQEVVNTDTRARFNDPFAYNIYNNGPFGTLTGSEEQLGIGYGISNIIEGKYWSKKDSIEKKIRLFDNINVSGFYNFVNDSMPWSAVSAFGNTTIIKGLTNFNFRTVFSPYVYDEKGKITNQTVWSAKKLPLEFVTFNGQFSTNVSFGKIKDILFGKETVSSTTNTEQKPVDSNSEDLTIEDVVAKSKEYKAVSLADWFSEFTIGHSYNFDIRRQTQGDTFVVTNHSINVNGSIPLTKNWRFGVGNISYDFKNKAFPFPQFSLSRDLHCWIMNFSWAPDIGTYSFFISVKSGSLNFLKYDYNQRSATNLFSGR